MYPLWKAGLSPIVSGRSATVSAGPFRSFLDKSDDDKLEENLDDFDFDFFDFLLIFPKLMISFYFFFVY